MLIYFVDIFLYQSKFKVFFLLLNIVLVGREVYSFPIVVVTNYYKPGGSKQYKFIIVLEDRLGVTI